MKSARLGLLNYSTQSSLVESYIRPYSGLKYMDYEAPLAKSWIAEGSCTVDLSQYRSSGALCESNTCACTSGGARA